MALKDKLNVIETNFNWKNGLSRRSTTRLIVLHHAAAKTASVAQINSWHKGNGWSGIGYHFYVRKNGEIYRGRPIWAVGAHAEGHNSNSIGICAEGNFDSEAMTMVQRTAIKELLKYLKGLYPDADIRGHKEVGATGCPGSNYPLDELKNYFKTMESEELTMVQYEELKKEISELRVMTTPMVYNYIDNNMPEWAKPTVQKLVNKGYLKGNENGLNLTDELLRILVINDRAGLYGE